MEKVIAQIKYLILLNPFFKKISSLIIFKKDNLYHDSFWPLDINSYYETLIVKGDFPDEYDVFWDNKYDLL